MTDAVQSRSTGTESPSMGKARQTVFNIMGRHPCCFRDDEPLQELIEDLAKAISDAAQAAPDRGDYEYGYADGVEWATRKYCQPVRGEPDAFQKRPTFGEVRVWTDLNPKQRDFWLEQDYEIRSLYAAPQPLDPAYTEKEPSVEVDEDCPIMDIAWRDKDRSFCIAVSEGKLVGLVSTLDPPRTKIAWTVNLPAGLLKIDPSAMSSTSRGAGA